MVQPFLLFKRASLAKEKFLYFQGVSACESLGGLVNVSVYLALSFKVLGV